MTTPTAHVRIVRRTLLPCVLALAAWTLPSNARAADLTCPAAATLDALATCIRGQMPASGSNGYVAPTPAQQADWQWVVRQMLDGACNVAMPASLSGIMNLRIFTDTGNGRTYCLLMEVRDADGNGRVDRGWGTFIVYPEASRELSHQAPHPISDSTTENEAIGIFRDTDSRSYLMAGAHRLANSGTSSCQSGYAPADAAHNADNMFQATNAELMNRYGAGSWWAIQWHGMAADTCTAAEVYLSHGRNVLPASGDKILDLKNNVLLYHPAWAVETTGTGTCSLNATDNTQGRLINGVAPAQVCGTAATSYTGRFLHIEQDPGFRTPADWVQAINLTWPAGVTPPPAPAALSATAGDTEVTLTWSAAAGADGYIVHRAMTSGGPYTAIASNVLTTSYADTTVTNGTTYYYVVSGLNAGGEGPASSETAATPQAPATLPAAPTGVTGKAGKKKATISWTAVAGAASYRVKRSTTSGGPYSVVVSGLTAASFTNTGLTSGVTYYFVVSAVNGAGEGPDSAQVSVKAR